MPIVTFNSKKIKISLKHSPNSYKAQDSMMDSRSSLISSLKPATKSSNLNQTKIRNQKLPIQNRSPRPLRNPFLSQQPLNRLKKGKWKTKTRRRSYRNLRLPVV